MPKLINIWSANESAIGSAANYPALTLSEDITSGATIAPLRIIASNASQAYISFAGGGFSSASYGTATEGTAFVIPVYSEFYNVWGFISAQKAL